MAPKALRPCGAPGGCPALVRGEQYCPEHEERYGRASQEKQRASSTSRGYDHKWRAARDGYLCKHMWCVECLKQGTNELATVVDHIVPHKGDRQLFWSKDNWQSLCKSHHDVKTAREDGGFGNRRK